MKRRTFITATALAPLAVPFAASAKPETEIMRLYREWLDLNTNLLPAVCEQCSKDLKASGLTGQALLDLNAEHDETRITPLNDRSSKLENRIVSSDIHNAREIAAKIDVAASPVFGISEEWAEILHADALFIMGEPA